MSTPSPLEVRGLPSMRTLDTVPSVGAASRTVPPSSDGYVITAFISTTPVAASAPDISIRLIRVLCSGRVGASQPASTTAPTTTSVHPRRIWRELYEAPYTGAGV